MDYGPLLAMVNKSTLVVYMYYDKFQDDNGMIQFTYNELNEHLGLATSTINNCNALLRRLKLIEEVDSAQGKKYKLLPVKKLDVKLRAQVLKKANVGYEQNTILRKRYLEEDIPPAFNQLLNKKSLQQAFKKLGTLRKGKDLTEYFKTDLHTFKLLMERDGEDTFKTKFYNLRKEIEQEANKPKKGKISANDRELATYLYDRLKDLGATPIHKTWFVKNCKIAQSILASITVEEAKQALDYGFNDNWWHDKITDLSSVEKLYARIRLQTKSSKSTKTSLISRSTPIPESIQAQITGEVKTSIQVNTYEDAALLKQSLLDGQDQKEIKQIVDILEKSGIIPTGKNNLKFG